MPPNLSGEVVLTGRPQARFAVRSPLLDPAGLRPEQAALHSAITQGPRSGQRSVVPIADENGRLLGPFGLMLISPEIGDAVQRLGSVLRFASALDTRSRELAILALAARLGSEFEWSAHERAALAAGITAGQLQALIDGELPDGLADTERLVVETVWAMAATRGLQDEQYERARNALGEVVLADLTWLVGYYSLLALALDVFVPAVTDAADGR